MATVRQLTRRSPSIQRQLHTFFSARGLRDHARNHYAEDIIVLQLVSGPRELESPPMRLHGAKADVGNVILTEKFDVTSGTLIHMCKTTQTQTHRCAS